MKKKLTLLILALFMTMGSVWAETYTVTYRTDGVFYNLSGTAVSGGWNASKWESNVEGKPVVTLSSTDDGALHSGNGNISINRTYTISVTGNYVITGYTIDLTGGWWGETTVTPAAGGDAVILKSASDNVVVSGLETKSTSFHNSSYTIPSPTITITLKSIEYGTLIENEFSSLFATEAAVGSYFTLKDADTKSSLKSTIYDLRNEIISEEDYTLARTAIIGGIKYPEDGKYYRIKNKRYNHYMAYGQPSSHNAGLIATSNSTDAASLIKLIGSKGTYKISVQGLNIQQQTSADRAFPGSEGTGVDFVFNISSSGFVSITNAASYVNKNNDGSLHETGWEAPAGVVNWSASAEASQWKIEDASSFNLTIGSTGYSTLWVPFAVTIPTGVEAYTGSINGDYLHLNEITGDVIPANTAVILKGSADTYTFDITDDVTGIDGNALLGSKGDVSGSSSIYALAQKGDPAVIGFYPVSSSIKVPANKAYLNISSGVKGFVFEFEDNATSINEELRMKEEASEPSIFNLVGQRIQKMQRGINIVNGKKVLY